MSSWKASTSKFERETNRLFVVEQGGRVFAITNLAVPNKTLFLDLSKQVRVGGDEGFFALAFHPGYATNGYFFAGYNLSTRTDAGSGPHYRVSRFSVSANDLNLASTNSELPLITQRYVGVGNPLPLFEDCEPTVSAATVFHARAEDSVAHAPTHQLATSGTFFVSAST